MGQRALFHFGGLPKPFKFQVVPAFSTSHTHILSVAVAEGYSVIKNHGERNKKLRDFRSMILEDSLIRPSEEFVKNAYSRI